jgi:hypothetical protein
MSDQKAASSRPGADRDWGLEAGRKASGPEAPGSEEPDPGVVAVGAVPEPLQGRGSSTTRGSSAPRREEVVPKAEPAGTWQAAKG